METSHLPIASIGLRHVVEDSLAYIDSDVDGTDRFKQVIGSLQDFLQKALRGVQMTSVGHHSVQVGDIIALETYSKLVDYFDASQDQLPEKVLNTSKTISLISAGQHPDAAQRREALDFLRGLLEKLYIEECFQLQTEPENIFLR